MRDKLGPVIQVSLKFHSYKSNNLSFFFETNKNNLQI